MGRVSGKVAVITGAGEGIGKATARLFAREGAKVFLISKTASKLEAVSADIQAAGGTAAFAAGDLSRPEDCEKVVKAALAAYGGRIDTLVNAAGVGYSYQEISPGSMNDTVNCTPEKWREVMNINMDSVFYMCRLALPVMIRQKAGVIVNVASIYGTIGVPNAHAYTTAKGAMINFTRSLCVTYAKDGIRTNTLAPGFIATQMVASVLPVFDDPVTAEAMCPMRRAGTAEEMAYAALFLGSDESAYCNGSMLIADGGQTAR